MLLKIFALPERIQLAVEAGAKRILPNENKRNVADKPLAVDAYSCERIAKS